MNIFSQNILSAVPVVMATTNGGITTSAYADVSKIAGPVYVRIILLQAVGNATVITPKQATDSTGTGSKDLTYDCQIMAAEDIATDQSLDIQTAGTDYTVTADIKNKVVEFSINQDRMDINNDFAFIGVNISDSTEATNFATIEIFGEAANAAEKLEALI
jgi:hypothetical protein